MWDKHNFLPCEHAKESLDDLSCEGNTHLHTQGLKQHQEEGQHLICNIWETEVTINKQVSQTNIVLQFLTIYINYH